MSSDSKSDSFAIDYQATLNCLEAARAAGARHFVMLSAFCVKSAEQNDPNALQFQYAKMDMEAALRKQSDVSYTIVRPTAFFKSVSGQVEVVDGGGPFVYFDLGAGKCATCNPISEPDLAAALVDTIADPSKEKAVLAKKSGANSTMQDDPDKAHGGSNAFSGCNSLTRSLSHHKQVR